MKGLTPSERDFLSSLHTCDGSCRHVGEASARTLAIADNLIERGLIVKVPCDGGGPWYHPRLTAAGMTAMHCDEAVRTKVSA